MWTYADDEELEYPGRIYPATETEYSFSQTGSGTNAGLFHNQAYQWTPSMVNQTTFGVRIDNYPPIGKGSVQVCYDLVEVTIEYSLPVTSPGKYRRQQEQKLSIRHLFTPTPLDH
jgi:hypothetical protein